MTPNRDELIEQALDSIVRGTYAIDNAINRGPGNEGPAYSRARAFFGRASVLIQLAGYLGMTEEEADRKATLEAIRQPVRRFINPDALPLEEMSTEEIEQRLGPDAGRA